MPKERPQSEGYLTENHHYFHLRDTAGQERDFHFHEFDKLVFLISGRVNYAVEDVVYDLRPGDVLPIGRRTIHKAVIDKSVPYERIIIYLNSDVYSGIVPDAGLETVFEHSAGAQHVLVLDDKRTRAVEEIFSSYEGIAAAEDRLSAAMRETYIIQLLITLSGARAAEGVPLVSADSRDPKIKSVIKYIDTHLNEELSVEKLCESVFLSRYHFMRLFKQDTGMTVHGYINQKRLINAARLIRNGTKATEAAAASGFGDYSVFHRAFRSAFGTSPAELKKQRQKNEMPLNQE